MNYQLQAKLFQLFLQDQDEDFKNQIKEFEERENSEVLTLYQSIKSYVRSARRTRIYMDGCFDLIHVGHFNAIRQCKLLIPNSELVVGVHSDRDIEINKGPTVIPENERYAIVRACKWIDEVVEGVSYSPTVELLDSLQCQFLGHGDDISTNAQGEDCFKEIKAAGRFRMFKRTEGCSTTDIVHALLSNESQKSESFLPTSYRLAQFSNNIKPQPNDRIVYISGSWDLLHAGHVEKLKVAKSQGDFLYVGIYDDKIVLQKKGRAIQSLHERACSLLSLRYVDEIILGVPFDFNDELIKTFNIGLIVKVKRNAPSLKQEYQIPNTKCNYKELNLECEISSELIVSRILDNKGKYQKSTSKKKDKQNKYRQERNYVEEIGN